MHLLPEEMSIVFVEILVVVRLCIDRSVKYKYKKFNIYEILQQSEPMFCLFLFCAKLIQPV